MKVLKFGAVRRVLQRGTAQADWRM